MARRQHRINSVSVSRQPTKLGARVQLVGDIVSEQEVSRDIDRTTRALSPSAQEWRDKKR